ncbi:MAG: DUF2267 domain-containing protein [Chitinivibrionales bacterium]|nr:DUF2267 domain-containing protein [Chitinivibrionales bacterium]
MMQRRCTMRYEDLLEGAMKTKTITDPETADSVVKAVFGILLSRMPEEDARELAMSLPAPLSFEKLRGHAMPSGLTIEQYTREIALQFGMSHEEARRVITSVLHEAKAGIDPGALHRWEKHLPVDWIGELESA